MNDFLLISFISKFSSPLILALILLFSVFLFSVLSSLSTWLFPVDKKKEAENNEIIYQRRAKQYLELEKLEKEMLKLEKLNYTAMLKEVTYKRNVLRNDFPNGLNSRELEIL